MAKTKRNEKENNKTTKKEKNYKNNLACNKNARKRIYTYARKYKIITNFNSKPLFRRSKTLSPAKWALVPTQQKYRLKSKISKEKHEDYINKTTWFACFLIFSFFSFSFFNFFGNKDVHQAIGRSIHLPTPPSFTNKITPHKPRPRLFLSTQTNIQENKKHVLGETKKRNEKKTRKAKQATKRK